MNAVLPMTETEYHADDTGFAQPSLSASLAVILCTQSPAHARAAHPRLNPALVRKDKHEFDIGTAAHALLLEGRQAVEVCEFPDWRTNAAKEARDAARVNGQIPLLGKHWDDVMLMVEAVREQLDAHAASPPLFADGKPEQTLVWEEDGVQCRSRLDWLRDDLAAVDDFKTTTTAEPDAWSRGPMLSTGAYVKAAFYLRGVRAIFGVDAEFRWCAIETSPPFALSVVAPGPDVMALAELKVDYALAKWRQCLASGEWPCYPTEVCYPELPAWEDTRWLEKTTREEQAA